MDHLGVEVAGRAGGDGDGRDAGARAGARRRDRWRGRRLSAADRRAGRRARAAVASSSAVLPEPGEPIRLIASTPCSRKCSRLCARLAVVGRPGCARARRRRRSPLGVAAAAGPAHQAPPSRCARARSRRPRPGAPGGRSARSAATPPAAMSRLQRGQAQRAAALSISSAASRAEGALAEDVVGACAAAPSRRRRARRCAPAPRCTRGAPCAARRFGDPVEQGLDDGVLVHRRSPPLRGPRRLRASAEEGLDALGELRAVGDARRGSRAPGRGGSRAGRRRRPRFISALATAEGPRRARRRAAARPPAPRRRSSRSGSTSLTSPSLVRRRGVEPRIEEHQVQRAAQPDQPRQEEGRALGAAQPGLAVGPLEAWRAPRRTPGRRPSRGRTRRRRATPSTAAMNGLGARRISEMVAVEVLEDLLEDLAVPGVTAAARRGREVAEVGRVAAGADVLEIGAAAEHAAGARAAPPRAPPASRASCRPALRRSCAVSTSSELKRSRRSMVMHADAAVDARCGCVFVIGHLLSRCAAAARPRAR